jgi:anti-sigma regulatory factor (Ser/Thr protein kinase)/GNAT superfamily N-acetyltransferase
VEAPETTRQQIGRLTLIADAAYLGAALGFVRETAGQLGLAPRDVTALARATEEVSLNVIEHAFEPGQPATFDIVLLRGPGEIVVAVEDRGLPFDWKLLEASPHSALTVPSLSGFADAVRFANLGPQGNRVEIVKRLPFRAIDAYPGTVKPGAVAPPPVHPEASPVRLRPMTPDDAVAVARCTYAVYGYTVPDDYLYFPDHMREMLHGGLLEVCVGENAEGEVVSCLTREVDRPGAAVGYLGEGMVEPRYRGHRLLEQMLAFSLEQARDKGMLGLYAEAVTVHPFSQKSNLALGAAETGVQLADEAPIDFKLIAESASKKRTATVLHYFKANQAPTRTVYPPEHHRAMVERIYERGRFDRTVAAAGPAAGPASAKGAQASVNIYPAWREAALRVTAYGSDLPDLVRLRLRELCLRRIDWISLDLPLSHPEARELCAPIETLGFFFAGIIPELADDDVLRLQYLNEVEADVDSAKLASDFGKELFDYVVAEMRARAGGA